jgi:hypothetical protein
MASILGRGEEYKNTSNTDVFGSTLLGSASGGVVRSVVFVINPTIPRLFTFQSTIRGPPSKMFPLGRTTSHSLASRTITVAAVTSSLVCCSQSATSIRYVFFPERHSRGAVRTLMLATVPLKVMQRNAGKKIVFYHGCPWPGSLLSIRDNGVCKGAPGGYYSPLPATYWSTSSAFLPSGGVPHSEQ